MSVAGRSITATDTGDSSINGAQRGITVTHAAASHLAVGGFSTTQTAGVPDGFSVTALDAFNNIDTGYTGTVHFSSSDPAAVLPSNYHFLSGDLGTQAFGATLKTAGLRAITATDTVTGSINGSQSPITIVPADADHLAVAGYPSPTTAGAAHSFTVTARDPFNNTATGYTGTVHFTSTDGAATLPANYAFTGPDAGVHTFSGTLRLVGPRRSLPRTPAMGRSLAPSRASPSTRPPPPTSS